MSKSKLSNLIDSVQIISQELEADHKAYVGLEQSKKSVHMNEARLQNLEDSYAEAKSLHQKIVAAPTEDAKVAYMEAQAFHKLKELYYKYSSDLKMHLHSNDNQNQTQSSLNHSMAGSKPLPVELKLPAIKIPSFSGSLQMWSEFKSLFESLVVKNSSISDVQKLHYLKANLSGEAERLLRNTAITDGNFESAWAILVKRYQNLRLLKDSQFRLLFNQPKLVEESADEIKQLLDTTNEAKQSLANLGVPVDSWEDVLVFQTVQKLPRTTLALWESHVSSYIDYPEYSLLEDFLLMRSRTLEVIGQTTSNFGQSKSKRTTSVTVRSHNSTVLRCSMCQGRHSIRNCFKFKALNIRKKQDIVRKYKLCTNCLSNAHTTQNCTSIFTCSLCNQKHHSLLHATEPVNAMHVEESRAQPNAATQAPSGNLSSSTSALAHNTYVAKTGRLQTVLLATAIIKVFTTDDQPIMMRALLDPGSEASFISESAATALNLKREKNYVQVLGVGQTKTSVSKHKVSFTMFSNYNKNFKLHLTALVLPKLTAILPTHNVACANWSHIQNIELADPAFNKPSKIDIILGSDIYPSLLLEGILKGEPGTPMAQRTELGWVLSGGISSHNQLMVTSLHTTIETPRLESILLKFWELEEVPKKKMLSVEEERCELHFIRTHQRQTDGKYVVQLPFKEGTRPTLGLSRKSALVRYLQLEKRFRSNAVFYSEYKKVFEEYKVLDHMTELDITSIPDAHYFVPHHAVMKQSSSTTKLRIVFDASCRTSNGTSVNDHLLVGPRLQDDIIDHLARFRKHKIGFIADISKMYRQIWVPIEDSMYQLILWRDVENEELKTYRLNTVIFGTAAAPYLAVRTLQQLAIDERDDYPIAAKIAKENFYVDDVIHGADSEDEAFEMQRQLTAMLKCGGFPLRKWASNSERLLKAVPAKDREVQLPFSFDEASTTKTLGIQWHPGKDIFTFKFCAHQTESKTKRTILSDIARLYDPMGWIAPCVIVGKIIMQSIWKEHQTWDSELKPAIVSSWYALKVELAALNLLEIPRWINITNGSQLEIHGFCDASEKAYGAAVYVRVINDEKISVNLLLSKTRVAPLKNKSLARLELCGALLLAHLLAYTTRTMNLQGAKAFAWCDSQIVLAWIKTAPYIRTTFVANRVAEIQELTNPNCWNYVSSKENPADAASRGLSPKELLENKQWWYGPQFLQTFDEKWHPKWKVQNTELETKTAELSKTKNLLTTIGCPFRTMFQLYVHHTLCETNHLFWRFSSLQRLVRATAYWLRFINNALKRSTGLSGPLSVEELTTARTRLITIVQQEFFAEEILSLLKGEGVSKGSKLVRLSPMIDEKRIIRVGGRLENADLPYSQRHPIVLPANNILTKLIVHDAHMRTLHGGQQLMMATLCTEYWILQLKSNVRSCIHKCLKCYRHMAAPLQQKMGNLPAQRVNEARPFQTSGVDYAGPVQLKAWKGRCSKTSKAYIAIFICFSTKAVHLELVSDGSTSAFIAAFRRFTARRGICANLHSDCGTNFQGAARIIGLEKTQLQKEWTEDIVTQLQANGTTWHFNPPAAPHFGGLWEAGVKSMKYHLKRIIGHHILTFEEYATVLTQVEACLNSRPLCPVSGDPEDLSILTPGHFLIGASLNTAPERYLGNIKENHLDRWKLLQKIQQDFWKKWKSEYLARLQQRSKWLTSNPNLKSGQLVLLIDEQTPPTLWRLGRILTTHPGSDGKIRVITIKTATTTLKRPITKICLLPIENQ